MVVWVWISFSVKSANKGSEGPLNHCKTASLRLVYGNNNVVDDSASRLFLLKWYFLKDSTFSLFDGFCTIAMLEIVPQHMCLFLMLLFVGYLDQLCYTVNQYQSLTVNSVSDSKLVSEAIWCVSIEINVSVNLHGVSVSECAFQSTRFTIIRMCTWIHTVY